MITNESAQTSTVLTSLGLDAPTLLKFKIHAGLDSDASWTEMDTLLQDYLLQSEIYINGETNNPYRPMVFTERAKCLKFSRHHNRHYLPAEQWPLKAGTTSITSKDNNGTVVTYVEGTDYEISNGFKPCFVFSYGFVPPIYNQVLYPWNMAYTAGGLQDSRQLIAIFQLAAWYQRFPEAIGKVVPDGVFESHVDAVCAGGFL